MEKRTDGMFTNSEVIKLCNEMKYFHEVLMVAGSFFDDLQTIQDTNENAFLMAINQCGVKAIITGMIEKQLKTIKRIEEMYTEDLDSLKKIRQTSERERHNDVIHLNNAEAQV